jgi:hypothetical protein
MTDDNIRDTLRQIEVARVSGLTRDEKISYLYQHGWRRRVGNKWQHRDGTITSFGAAVTAQMLRDLTSAQPDA